MRSNSFSRDLQSIAVRAAANTRLVAEFRLNRRAAKTEQWCSGIVAAKHFQDITDQPAPNVSG